MTFYEEIREVADELLEEFGTIGVIKRQDGSEHVVRVALVDYSHYERGSGMIQMTDKRAIVSAVGLTIEPEANEDTLIVGGIEHSIRNPMPIKPADTIVLWEMTARR